MVQQKHALQLASWTLKRKSCIKDGNMSESDRKNAKDGMKVDDITSQNKDISI